jgi:hypothetical protein
MKPCNHPPRFIGGCGASAPRPSRVLNVEKAQPTTASVSDARTTSNDPTSSRATRGSRRTHINKCDRPEIRLATPWLGTRSLTF